MSDIENNIIRLSNRWCSECGGSKTFLKQGSRIRCKDCRKYVTESIFCIHCGDYMGDIRGQGGAYIACPECPPAGEAQTIK